MKRNEREEDRETFKGLEPPYRRPKYSTQHHIDSFKLELSKKTRINLSSLKKTKKSKKKGKSKKKTKNSISSVQNPTNTPFQYGQYFSMYNLRYEHYMPILKKRAKKYHPDLKIIKTSDLMNDDFEDNEIIVIGMLIKNMKKQPSILKNQNEGTVASNELEYGRTSYLADDDELYLGDMIGRVHLIPPKQVDSKKFVSNYTTGSMIACVGKRNPEKLDSINVTSFLFPSVDPLKQPPMPNFLKEDRYILFVSGFNVQKQVDPRISLLVDYITGINGSDAELKSTISKITKVVIAGNMVRPTQKQMDKVASEILVTRSVGGAGHLDLVEPISNVDKYLAAIGKSVDIDIMPGATDPVNMMFPQQPIHRSCIPKSYELKSIMAVTNPHSFTCDGVLCTGTSGQNVDNFREYSSLQSPLDIMEYIVSSGHIAPTLPDMLRTFSYNNSDPFIINQVPHLFFAGNQPSFGERSVQLSKDKAVTLLSIPTFSETGEVVLFCTRTRKSKTIKFSFLDH